MYYSSMKHCNLQAIYLPPDKYFNVYRIIANNIK